jgi:hypothetical protein
MNQANELAHLKELLKSRDSRYATVAFVDLQGAIVRQDRQCRQATVGIPRGSAFLNN